MPGQTLAGFTLLLLSLPSLSSFLTPPVSESPFIPLHPLTHFSISFRPLFAPCLPPSSPTSLTFTFPGSSPLPLVHHLTLTLVSSWPPLSFLAFPPTLLPPSLSSCLFLLFSFCNTQLKVSRHPNIAPICVLNHRHYCICLKIREWLLPGNNVKK